jgi:uncharacterized MnhB-related membrane protein
MVTKIELVDYSILAQLVVSLFVFIFSKIPYKSLIVYASLIIFFSYWLIRIVFNPEFKHRISGN